MLDQTTPFDSADYLDSPEAVIGYLAEAFESQDPGVISDALGVIARAKGMSEIATAAGVNRTALYRSLSKGGKVQLDTLLKVMGALGVHLSVVMPDAA